MYSTEQYIKDTISFTNSLIVKFSGASYSINKGIEATLGEYIDEDDKYTHKYYLNLSGNKHHTNNNVKIRLLEDNLEYSLTKELLEENTSTRNKLLQFTTYYKNLIANYPDDIDYIRGCILPVDIDKAIEAKDGTILAYSNLYVYDNELSIIREINEYTQSFFTRWYIPEYLITDELYAASIVGSLVSTIPSVILNSRLRRVKTNEVHNFHLEHYFRSKLNIWDEISVLKRETIIWLYINLDVLVKNIGKQETIEAIVNKVLDTNGIGVGVYKLKDGGQRINSDSSVYEPYITKNGNYLRIEALNKSYSIHNNEKVTLNNTTELQVKENDVLGIPDNYSTVLNNYVDSKLKYGTVNDELTKVIDIDYGTIFKSYGNDLFLSTLDTLYKTSKDNVYINVVTYTDPNSKRVYNINGKIGFYLILFHMLKLAKIDISKVNSVNITKVLNYNITIDQLTKNIHDKATVLPIAKLIKKFIPTLPVTISTTSDFNTLLSNMRKLFTKVWILDSNVNNANVSASIKKMVSRMYTTTVDTIGTDGSLEQTLVENGILLNIGEAYDHIASIETIFKLLTGNELSDVVKYNKNNDIIKSLVNKLTSYTVNVISSINDSEPLYAPYTTIQTYNSNNGLIVIEKADIVSAYETDEFYVTGYGNDFKDDVRNFNLLSKPNISFNVEQRVHAYNIILNDVNVIEDKPNMRCEIVNAYKNIVTPV